MVKIEEIRINGYKNIESADLKLGNFNVIIGANNSGKSNFIQTISFLNYIINSSSDDVEKSFTKGLNTTSFNEIIPFLSDKNIRNIKDLEEKIQRSGTMSFELVFSNTETNRIFTYFLEIEWTSLMYINRYKIKNEKLEVKETNKPGKPLRIFIRENESVKYGTEYSKMDVVKRIPDYISVVRVLKIISDVTEDYKDALDSLSEILKTPIFYFSHIELLKSDKERINAFNGRIVSFELENEIIELEESNKWSIFKNAIQNILNIDDVLIYKFGGDNINEKIPLTKFLSFKNQGMIKSLRQFSDGTILIIALITKILNSVHPKALIDLISFIKSFSENIQVIITSHSIALLNKTRIEDVIASCIDENGFCNLYNINSRKEIKNKFKKSHVNFSDELFFNLDVKNEFE